MFLEDAPGKRDEKAPEDAPSTVEENVIPEAISEAAADTTPMKAEEKKPPMARANPRSEAIIPLPECPYSDKDNIEEGVTCFIPDCQHNAFSWSSMFQHVKHFHAVKQADLVGTHLHTKGLAELNEKQNKRRQQKPKPKGAAKAIKKETGIDNGATEEPVATTKQDEEEQGEETKEAMNKEPLRMKPADWKEFLAANPHFPMNLQAPKTEEPVDLGISSEEAQQSDAEPAASNVPDKWVAMLCWVKCTSTGLPMTPLEYGGLAVAPAALPKENESSVEAQAPEDKPAEVVNVSHDGQRRLDQDYDFPCKGDALQMTPLPEHVDTSKQTQLTQYVGSSSSHQGNGQELVPQQECVKSKAPLEMVAELYQEMKTKQQEEHAAKNWKSSIPNVSLKQAYTDAETPLAKREQGVGRASWPKHLKKDKVELKDFQKHLDSLHTGEAQQNMFLTGAGRALGVLDISDDTPITDVKVLVGFFLNDTFQSMVDLALLHPKFFWTSDLLEGLGSYINFWLWKLKAMKVTGGLGPVDHYKDCLELLLTAMKAGHLKRCNEHKEQAFRAKGQEDLYVLKHFPSIKKELQPAVQSALLVLKGIGEQYIGQPTMPQKALGLANVIISGVWEYNTYMGRKWEIEHCLVEDMEKVLDEGQEYLVCKQHKTSKIYGDIIKYLTPGLLEALKIYRQLPKPSSKYFLVPVTIAAQTISHPACLKSFNQKFLKTQASPTCNQVRKLFHKQLIKMTKHEEALKAMMTQLDAHGRQVIDKHYLVKDPEDDLALAKVLVETALGATVPWPAEEQSLEQDLEDLMDNLDPNPEEEIANEEDDPDEEPLEHWAHGALFGIKPTGHLNLIPLSDMEPAGLPLQNAPQQDQMPKGEKKEKKDKEQKKEKKENQEKKSKGHKRERAAIGEADDDAMGSNTKKQKRDAAPAKEEELPSGSGLAKKKFDKIPKEKQRLYDEYTEEKDEHASVRRCAVSEPAHKWMEEELVKWQTENSKGQLDLPYANEWYYDKRVEGIIAGHLFNIHSKDVVRSHLTKTFFKKLKAKVDAEKVKAVQDVD